MADNNEPIKRLAEEIDDWENPKFWKLIDEWLDGDVE